MLRMIASVAAALSLGVTAAAFVLPVDATAATFSVVHAFQGGSDGSNPWGGVIFDHAGNLYGTTANSEGGTCCGTVFELAPDGTETLLYTFEGSDGETPISSLIRDAAGNLYGTTLYGGSNGYGTVFLLPPNGQESTIHSFTNGSDGTYPETGVIEDGSGNFYGTTTYGGSGSCSDGQNEVGCGIVFELASNHAETVLYSFSGSSDGAWPNGLIRDKAGNLYGTASNGGAIDNGDCFEGCGVVFKLAPNKQETALYTFNWDDGAYPIQGLTADKSGNFYGTASNGGTGGCGVVFKLTAKGTQTILHTFKGKDGCSPESVLILDKGGNLYGTTIGGGKSNSGEVFRLTPAGKLSVLHHFSGGTDGAYPNAQLLKVGHYLYGTANGGGDNGYGTLFKVKE